MNESGRQKIGRQKSCPQVQHAKLYFDLPQAEEEGTFDGSYQEGLMGGGGGGEGLRGG